MKRWIVGLGVLVALLGALAVTREAWMGRLPPRWQIALHAWRTGLVVDHDVAVPMPDGVTLRASLYRPRGADGKLPTVLVRLPYHRNKYPSAYHAALSFARAGYAVLVQDLRGTGDSAGELLPWKHAADDGVATLDWIAQQPWADGKVGTFGCSGLGETQLILAARNHPAHRALIASGAGGAVGSAADRHAYFGLFEGGVFQLASGFGWFVDHGATHPGTPPPAAFDRHAHLAKLPVASLVAQVRPGANGYADFLATPPGDARWDTWGYLTPRDRIAVPSLVINTWGDQTLGDTLAYHGRGLGGPQVVVIGPGNHCQHRAPGERFGVLPIADGSRPYDAWYLRWFDKHLRGKGEGLAQLKPFNFYMLGENRWIGSDTWPPAQMRPERWYPGSGGRANSRAGNGVLARTPQGAAASDAFRYDPMDPVPSRGGPLCCTGDARDVPGPQDQADVEAREDVLVYTSPPLAAPLRIAGPVRLTVAVSSSAPDTDLVARLAHVFPDGRSVGIQEGALRLRYRDGFGAPRFMQPGVRYEATVDMRAIAYAFPAGHRLRLHVTSSSFPRLERNLNTGAANNALETRAVVAENRVHYGGASALELPVLLGQQ